MPRIVVMTGAGVSAESGIQTFRGAGGLWEGNRLDEVASPIAWAQDPSKVWRFYQGRRRQLAEVEPNPAHLALVQLERALPKGNFCLVSQNVDDLHQRAGSLSVLPMHGELRKLRCEKCGEIQEMMEEQHLSDEHYVQCPKPQCGNAGMRPHIVWFHEMPLYLDEIDQVMTTVDVLLIIGTSGTVYPANELLPLARTLGAFCVCVNLEPPVNVSLFHEYHQGRAGDLVPAIVKRWTTAISKQ
jgi:NAD-dependent deacetylase